MGGRIPHPSSARPTCFTPVRSPGEVSSESQSPGDVLPITGAAQHRLSLATSTRSSEPRSAAREQLAPACGFCRLLFVPALSSQTMAAAAGVLPICWRPFLGFPARVQALAGSARWPGIPSSTFLAAVAWLCFYAD